MLGEDMTTKITSLESDLKIYFWVVFGYSSGLIPLRSFPEKGNPDSRPITNAWVPADDHVHGKVLSFATATNRRKAAFYVIPGTVEKSNQASSADIVEMQVLLIDIDEGDTEGKLLEMATVMGEPTMVVESGGITKEGHPKLHVYWQLEKSVSGEDLQLLLELRHKIALAFGGDTHFKSAHQPIRVAGSVYHKGGNARLVKIRSYSRMEYNLQELVESLGYLLTLNDTNSSGGSEIANSVGTTITSLNDKLLIDEIFTNKIHEGGNGECSRFANLQRITGYWLRRYHEGLVTQEEALEEIIAYNEANVVPPWPLERIKQMTEGLWKKHMKENGEAKKVEDKCKLTPINPACWQGTPPEREWIIQDWLPRGYVTALYGDGGVGKSLFAQQLMTCLITGNPILGLNTKASKVYALMCEDDENELWRRQANINKYYGLQMSNLGKARLISRVGEDNLLMLFNNSDVGKLTQFFDHLRQDILEHRPDLIILDTVADLFGGNENNRPQVRQFIQTACGALARDTGGAVLLCAHPSEGGISKGTGSGGSTAWNNTVRSRWYLKRPEGNQFNINHRVLTRVKSNYATLGQEEYMEWNIGVLVHLNPLDFSPRKAGYIQAERHDEERDRKTEMIIKVIEAEALEGRLYTANQFSEAFEGKHGFGSKRCIHNRVSIAATVSRIQFLEDPTSYGLNLKSCNYGYLCTKNTFYKKPMKENPETGEVQYELIKLVPTHFKNRLNGSLLEIENCG
jgi:RecA-family ATPase